MSEEAKQQLPGGGEGCPRSLEYPTGSMADCLWEAVQKYPDYWAYQYYGTRVRFREFWEQVLLCERALLALGVKENDKVTLCLPNIPQTVMLFYAINRIGAWANMVHPLSAVKELTFFVTQGESRFVFTMEDRLADTAEATKETNVERIVGVAVEDYLPPLKKTAMRLATALQKKGKSKETKLADARILSWRTFWHMGETSPAAESAATIEAAKGDATRGSAPAVILYSGGTTGTMKGIVLSNYNLNALARQTIAAAECVTAGDKMLAAMPMFHGFGLGICVHTALVMGGECILVPRLKVKEYASLLRKYRPNYIAGVPTLYEALLRCETTKNLSLSFLKGVFCGGDSLSPDLKKRVDAFLAAHGATEQIREGYGLTECVTASCLTPRYRHKEGSIGVPFPDTYYKIVDENENELPYGETGEICLRGPSVMVEYYRQPEETRQVFRRHADGEVWLHTGDLGKMDEEGFVYFCQRKKRVIISSGYNIYPSRLEAVLDEHPDVLASCVIGVPDSYRMQVPKAFVVLKQEAKNDPAAEDRLREWCRMRIAKHEMPKLFEFREELPKTTIGKVAYRALEEEELQKRTV